MNAVGHECPPVVGIAASAAGLDALKDFLAAIPQATGMAWVVLLHPGPNHAAFDATLLGAVALPVRLVENGTRIAANHVYTPSPSEAEFDVLTVGFGTIQLCA